MILKLVRFKLIIILLIIINFSSAKERPCLLFNTDEVKLIRAQLGEYPLFDQTLSFARQQIDLAIVQPIDLPPPGEAGGYAHEKHKQNYRDIQQAGQLFIITGEEKYAEFVRKVLLEYADFYPDLGSHPLSRKQAPGKIFHQMLNENVWLVHASVAFDCVYSWLNDQDRAKIEKNVFRLMTYWIVNERGDQLDRIHNHGTWASAALGMAGYVLNDQNLVDIALYGTKKDGKAGFLKQMDLLLSPDGYYTEGPYYIRYALRPFFYFAEAIERNQPELKIFNYRDQILRKTFYATVQTMMPNGVYPSINDASRTMNVLSAGTRLATNICYYRYGQDQNILGLANMQQKVELTIAGLILAKDLRLNPHSEVNWESVELRDGFDGQSGGIGILRNGKEKNRSYLLMKYGTHGGGHGHFDQLSILMFDVDRQVLTDYGYARWINIEPKSGGRYLPENKTYANQTIAHNTVVVDGKSQNGGNSKEADNYSGKRHFFDGNNHSLQVVSAVAENCYDGVKMQRTIFWVTDSTLTDPIIVDLFFLLSDQKHSYDYSVHLGGQLMTTDLKYTANTEKLSVLGEDHGYQHLWVTARSVSKKGFSYTWLDGNKYYSMISNASEGAVVSFCRIGANDPSFNLRSEPALVIREEKKNHLFVAVFEPHGYFSEALEKSVSPTGQIESVKVLAFDPDEGAVVAVSGKNGLCWVIMTELQKEKMKTSHKITSNNKTWEWTGRYQMQKLTESEK